MIGRPREDGPIADDKDVRLWNMISIAGGATGIMYPRWRPLLVGPLFGAFGAFGMDGAVTPRAEMAGKVARWANANPDLWKSRPVRGDVGIVWVPESQIFNYVQQGSTDHYAQSVRGAYQGFFDNNFQADFVHIDHIREYPFAYLPYPIHLRDETVRKLAAYVQVGGVLVSEGLPAYFGDRGKVGTVQPNTGLDKLFGARETCAEFTPDLLGWAGVKRTLAVSDPLVKARLHRGGGGAILYVINPTREERPVTIELPEAVRSAKDVWGDTAVRIDGRRRVLTLGDRNAAVLRLN